MSRRSKHLRRGSRAVRALPALVAWAAVVMPSALCGQTSAAPPEITAFVENGGRVVFTNMAAAPATSAASLSLAGAVSAAVPYADLIATIAERHGVNATLVHAVIEVESAYDRFAVSPKNARGLMQLIPETGRRFGVRDFFSPQENIDGGVRYLRFLLDKFDGNMDLSLAAYNAGENLVARLGRIPNIPETVSYVRKVRTALSRMGGAPTALRAETSPAWNNDTDDRRDDPGARGFSDAPIAGTVTADGVRSFSNLNGF